MLGRGKALASVVASVLVVALPSSASTAVAADAGNASHAAAAARGSGPRSLVRPGPDRVGVVDYTLGDRAFSVKGLCSGGGGDGEHCSRAERAPLELTGRAWYPTSGPHTHHPLVILLHGSWDTCADRRASIESYQASALENAWFADHPPTLQRGQKEPGRPNPDQARLDRILTRAGERLLRWPCAPGTPAIPSYLGFGYLGRALASHGITAVSISANGVNAVGLGDIAVQARAALIDEHLAMWARLDRTGGGPLAGHFTHPGTDRPAHPDFRHTIDLHDVGTLGHSRGGKAVFWQAADAHRSDLPAGVTLKAMVSLAPEGAAEIEPGDPDASNYIVGRLPVLVWMGTCDAATGNGGDDYLRFNRGHNHARDYRLLVAGANHDFLNTEWSPSSGQVDANDDNDTPGIPRADPGHCGPRATSPSAHATRQLGEAAERRASTLYVTAFFLRELSGQHRWQPVLDGSRRPLRKHVHTTITTVRPH